MFYSDNLSKGWDGRYKQESQNTGIFTWKSLFKFEGGEKYKSIKEPYCSSVNFGGFITGFVDRLSDSDQKNNQRHILRDGPGIVSLRCYLYIAAALSCVCLLFYCGKGLNQEI